MAKTQSITADFREDVGKGASRRLRRSGWVPAVLYGADRPARKIQLNHKEVMFSAGNERFFSSILDLDFNGKHQKVLLRDWQMHPVRQQMLHLDFMRVRDDVEINVSIPLHFLNQEKSPAGKASDIVVSHHMTEVEVTCLPGDLPENIEVDLAELAEDDVIHLSEIQPPEGVKITALMHEEGHDYTVVSAQKVKVQIEEPTEGEVVEGEVPVVGEDTEEGAKAEAEKGDESTDKDDEG